MYDNYRNTVANVDASDSRCRCIGEIIGRDLRLVASRLNKMAVTQPGSRAAITREHILHIFQLQLFKKAIKYGWMLDIFELRGV